MLSDEDKRRINATISWGFVPKVVILGLFALAGCVESDVEKSTRRQIESRPACTKPQQLDGSMMEKLTGLGVLVCKAGKASECQPQSPFASSIRILPELGYTGLPLESDGKGPQVIMLCGRGTLGKVLKEETYETGNGKVAEIRFEVNIEMSDTFKASPQSKELASLFALPSSYKSAMRLIHRNGQWIRD